VSIPYCAERIGPAVGHFRQKGESPIIQTECVKVPDPSPFVDVQTGVAMIGRPIGLAPLFSAACLFFGAPAVADIYPVNGVWVAPDLEFPIGVDAACFSLRTSGVQAVAKKLIGQLVIFNESTRYDLKGNVEVVSTLLSAKPAAGGYMITELPIVRSHFWFRRKHVYFLTIVDSTTIEMRDRLRRTRLENCVPRGKLPI
jgi:hypothetical protein